LKTFIRNKYMTSDEKRLFKAEKRTLYLQIATLLIALVSIICNIYISVKKYDKVSTHIIIEKMESDRINILNKIIDDKMNETK
jgi:hypothetical protein